MDELAGDERAITEANGVAILVGMTIIVTATVGLNVLVVAQQDTGPPGANFSYDYVEGSSALIITHVEGNEFPAGELLIEGPESEVTWAEVADMNETQPVGPGDIAQISQENAYGKPLSTSTKIRIYHVTDGNRTQLSEWP